jgi:hypothetical protein
VGENCPVARADPAHTHPSAHSMHKSRNTIHAPGGYNPLQEPAAHNFAAGHHAHNQSISRNHTHSLLTCTPTKILIPHVRRNRSMGQKPFLLHLIHISNAAAVLEKSLHFSFACDSIEVTTPPYLLGLCTATAPTRRSPDASRWSTMHACPIILYWPPSLDWPHVLSLATSYLEVMFAT